MSIEEQVEALIASIQLTSIATVITDPRRPDNPIIAANAAFETLTGHSARDVIGRNCRLLRGVGTDLDASAALRNAVAGGTSTMVELLNYRRNGTSFWNAVMIAPILGDDGEPILFIGSQMEVSPPTGERTQRRQAAHLKLESLTRRQRQVIELMAQGLLNKQIAYELGIAEKTVKMHRAALLEALAVRSSADAIRLAVEAGL